MVSREITLRQVGGSLGATIPKDMADRLHLNVGDKMMVTVTEQGLLFSPYDPAVEAGLSAAARAAKQYRNALRELAK
jgi:putative addiction module antidote